MKLNLDEVVRCRVPRKLKARLARIATAKAKTLTEASREAIREYVEAEEAKIQDKDTFAAITPTDSKIAQSEAS